MHIDQSNKAEELITALGILGRAQEDGADDDVLSDLNALAQAAAHEFRQVFTPVQ